MSNAIGNRKSTVVLRSAKGRSIREAVIEVMERSGWDQVVPRDALVVVKPNLCTAVPDKAASSNTDPEVAATVCELLLTRTRRVIFGESDGLRQKAQEAFAVSGYLEIAKRFGIELMNLSDSPWKAVHCDPAGMVELPQVLLDADVFITLPVLKTHALTYFTGAIKNQWGCLPQYNRILLHKYLDPLLATLHRVLRPRLAIMDGVIGMEGRGPANGKPRRMDLILGSQDSVALDTTAMRLIGLEPARSRHVVLTAAQGLGRMSRDDITIDGDFNRHATTFEPAVLDKAIAAMNYMSRYRWFVRHMLERDTVFYPIRGAVQLLRRVGVVEGG
jgi:uncharacterized protein (DUF362 family)